jgi:hypothetical protein
MMMVFSNLEEEKYKVQLAMRTFGGSFFEFIGEALARADMNNTLKIKRTWAQEWKEYLELYKHMDEAKK